MTDRPIYYARPYRGWQQHKVREVYSSNSSHPTLVALCGSKTTRWSWECGGYGSGTYTVSEPWSHYPVCRACSALPAGQADAVVGTRLPYADDRVEELPL